jgi:predicted  nucleic acid-binding Zn-ribbon protein
MDHEIKRQIKEIFDSSISEYIHKIEAKRAYTTDEIKGLQKDVIRLEATVNERMKNIEEKFSEITKGNEQSAQHEMELAVLKNDVKYIKITVEEIKIILEKDYVKRSEFDPVKKIVYGMVGIILTSVVVGVLTLVLRR